MALFDRPVTAVAAQAADWGFEGVELLCRPGGHVEPDTGEERARELAGIFRSAGVRVTALAGYIKFNAETEPELRENYEDLVRQVRLAEILGAESVRCLGGRIGEERWRKGRDGIIDMLSGYLRAAAVATSDSDVHILQVTHDEFASGPVLGRLLDAAAHPRVGAAWNVVHPLSAGEEPETTWEEIGSRVRHVHLRDAVFGEKDGGPGGRPVPFGQGDVPWERIAGLMTDAGYDGWISIEWPVHMQSGLSPAEDVLPEGLRFLREKFNKLGSVTYE